jgi:hypothetical protein
MQYLKNEISWYRHSTIQFLLSDTTNKNTLLAGMPIIKTYADVSSTLTGKLTTIEEVELN